MFDDMNAWLTFGGVLVTNLGTWVVTQRKSRYDIQVAVQAAHTQAETARIQADATHAEHRGPEWDLYVTRLEAHFEKRLCDQDAKIEKQGQVIKQQDIKIGRQDVKIDRQGKEIESLRENVADSQYRYRLALEHIGEWRGRHPETVELIRVPPEIAPDLQP